MFPLREGRAVSKGGPRLGLGRCQGTAALPTGGSSLGSCSLHDLNMPLCCSSFLLHVSNIKVNTELPALEDSSFLSIEDSSVLH